VILLKSGNGGFWHGDFISGDEKDLTHCFENAEKQGQIAPWSGFFAF
jgi:hypothetical protein